MTAAFTFAHPVLVQEASEICDVAAFENDLKTRRVKLFFYNSQASDSAAQRLLKIAQDNRIPVVGVTETQPQGKTFQQ